MANKSVNMALFILSLITLGPILIVSAIFGFSWWWQGFTGCFFASTYSTCGYGEFTKAALFSFLAFGCFIGIQKMWTKAK